MSMNAFCDREDAFIEREAFHDALHHAAVALRAERGRFYPDKSFGSQLSRLTPPVNAYALAYARQALAETDGVFAVKAEKNGGMVQVTLLINNEEGTVSIRLNEEI